MATPKLRIAGNDERALPARMVFTEARVREIACKPGQSRRTVYDQATFGLALTITAAGSKSFYWYGRVKGQTRPIRFHIGDIGAVSVDGARTIAKDVAAKAAQGMDPRESRRAAKEHAKTAITVAELWTEYLGQHLTDTASMHTVKTDASRYKNHLSAWAKRDIRTITPEQVVTFHDDMSRNKLKGPNIADKTIKLLRRMFTFKKIKPNPAAGAVKFHGDDQRDRFLTQDELTRLLVALGDTENQVIADVVRFALLTGARRGNVCAARWQDIHLDQALWIIPKDQSKNGRPMTIGLAPPAIALLRRRQDLNTENATRRMIRYGFKAMEPTPYVFPGGVSISEPVKEIKATWAKVCKAAKIEGVRFHDLRHTTASWMAMTGASLLLIGKQLGHASKQSTARYAHLELSAVRPATDAAIAVMFGSETPDEVK